MNLLIMIVTSRKSTSIFNVIRKPNDTFRQIYDNVDDHFRSAIAILIISSFFAVSFTFPSETLAHLPTNELGYVLDVEIEIIDFIVIILSEILLIVLIFYVGKKFGGSKNFRGVFSVLSYALIPALIGGFIVSILLFYPPLLEFVSGIDTENDVFPMLFWILYLGIFAPSTIWSLILSIKAIKIANGFGTRKSIGIIILSSIISYAVLIPFFEWNIINHPYFG